MTRIACGDCIGSGPCETCGGEGSVVVRAARDVLEFDVFGHWMQDTIEEALDLLDEHRPELMAWLIERGIVIPTVYGWEPIPHDATKASWSPGYIAPGSSRVVDVTEGRPLFLVVDQ